MTQLVQVTQREFGRPPVVKNNVGDAGNPPLSSHGDHGNRQLMLECRINGNDAFRAPPTGRVLFNHVDLVACCALK